MRVLLDALWRGPLPRRFVGQGRKARQPPHPPPWGTARRAVEGAAPPGASRL